MWLIRKLQHHQKRNDGSNQDKKTDTKSTKSHPLEIPKEKSIPTSNLKNECDEYHTTTPPASTTTTKGITIAIAGGGIVGLTLALCLHKHLITQLITNNDIVEDEVDDMQKTNNLKNNNNDMNITIIIYEQASAFVNDIGAGMSLYTNGLRVIRDIDLLENVITNGYHYQYRHWTRHDGTIIATASEEVLSSSDDQEETEIESQKLETIGIRRWKLQKILYDEVKEKNIHILFGKKIINIQRNSNTHASEGVTSNIHHTKTTCDNKTTTNISNESSIEETFHPPIQLIMNDGTIEYADILLVADGAKSCIREQLLSRMYNNDNIISKDDDENQEETVYPTLTHCGITCLMGVSNVKNIKNNKEILRCIKEEESFDNTTSTTTTTSTSTSTSNSELETDVSMGISFPSSHTTGCHGVFFPTSKNEKCFQFYFPTSTLQQNDNKILSSSWNNTSAISNSTTNKFSSWGTMNSSDIQMECNELIKQLKHDGWHNEYIEPLENATSMLRIGLSLLEPTSLNQYVYSLNDVPYQDDDTNINENNNISQTSMNRIVLLGDSAHPTVPYLGQGSQLGLEDAGVLALLIKHFCIVNNDTSSSSSPSFSLKQWDHAMHIYEQMRTPRIHDILKNSLQFGLKQEMRSGQTNDNDNTNNTNDITTRTSRRLQCEEQYKRDVFFHETLPSLLPGVQYNYQTAVKEAIIESSSKSKIKNKHKKHNI